MSLVPHTQWRLARMRKSMSKALQEQDWDKVREFDVELMQALNDASEDTQRDSAALLNELQAVVELYKDLVLSSNLHRDLQLGS